MQVGGSLVGGLLVAVGAFFPWATLGGASTSDAFDVPAAFLFDKTADPGGLKLGLLLLGLGACGVAAAFKAPLTVRRAVAGAIAVVVVLFVIQLQRAVGGAEVGSVFAHLGFGVLLAAGGAFCLWTGQAAAVTRGRGGS